MTESANLREFLKNEALKKFNGDYDILYNYVKDHKVGNSTFRNILKSYYINESDLIEIENTVPSLTIFVPSLPKNSFSAENWNISRDIPLVAVRLLDNNKTPLISYNSKATYLIIILFLVFQSLS